MGVELAQGAEDLAAVGMRVTEKVLGELIDLLVVYQLTNHAIIMRCTLIKKTLFVLNARFRILHLAPTLINSSNSRGCELL